MFLLSIRSDNNVVVISGSEEDIHNANMDTIV